MEEFYLLTISHMGFLKSYRVIYTWVHIKYSRSIFIYKTHHYATSSFI